MLVCLAGAAFVAGCREEEAAARRFRPVVIALVPRIDRSLAVDTTGTEDTERLTMVAPVSGDSVRAFYRSQLPQRGWRIQSDRSAGNLVDMYARTTGTGGAAVSLWIHIERQDSLSSRYTLIANVRGIAPDSARR
jgi:hypothetical protein